MAVFPVVGQRIQLDKDLRDALTAYVASRIAETPGYSVMPSDQLDVVLSKVKAASHSEAFDDSMRAELGKELPARTGAWTQIIKIGGVCKVSIKFYDLKTNTSGLAFGEEGDCDEVSLGRSIRTALQTFAKHPKLTEISVGIRDWGGYYGGLYFNGGLEPSARSQFRKKYGLDVSFKVLRSIRESVAAWRSGEVDIMWITVDDLPTEYADIARENPILFLQTGWSRGEETLVARANIETLNDLRGKRVVLEKNTTAHSFLLISLDLAGLDYDDVQVIGARSNKEAADIFIRGGADAAVVWIDEDKRCLAQVPGAWVIETTEDASYLIAESLMVKADVLRPNRQAIANLAKGWLLGNAAINANPNARRAAANLAARSFGIRRRLAEEELRRVRLATYGDNRNFFGLNPRYRGEKGEDLYAYFWSRYDALPGSNLPPKPAWRSITDRTIVRSLDLQGRRHAPEAPPDFSYCADARHQRPLSNKSLSVQFAPNRSVLNARAKRSIHKKFGHLAEIYFHDCIRVDGNTDSRGGRRANIALSKRRAQAVKNYLVRRYGFDPRRVIAVGNGPDKPIASNATAAGRAKNRRTDFELLH